jgi:hypothetical protein
VEPIPRLLIDWDYVPRSIYERRNDYRKPTAFSHYLIEGRGQEPAPRELWYNPEFGSRRNDISKGLSSGLLAGAYSIIRLN